MHCASRNNWSIQSYASPVLSSFKLTGLQTKYIIPTVSPSCNTHVAFCFDVGNHVVHVHCVSRNDCSAKCYSYLVLSGLKSTGVEAKYIIPTFSVTPTRLLVLVQTIMYSVCALSRKTVCCHKRTCVTPTDFFSGGDGGWNECAWSETLSQCFSLSYLPIICLAGRCGRIIRGGSEGCMDSCASNQQCSTCMSSYNCGWCGEKGISGEGQCYEGGLQGQYVKYCP